MLTYNSQLRKLVLPEYGRNIQNMVDYCLSIPDRDERTHCAYSIVQYMSNLFPELRQEPDYRHKLWDHLAIMSNFELDIDYPYEVALPEELNSLPQPIPYEFEHIKARQYGKIIERMIQRAAEYPEGDERDALVMLLANHMKKLIFQINKEVVDDAKIFKDLAYFSKGRIQLDPATHVLHEFQEAPQQQGNQGKRKRKR